MKKALALVPVLLVAAIVVSCISAQPAYPLGQQFSLAIGETAGISGEDLAIRFVDVAGDSRCPTGVVCIWAGQVDCLVDLTSGGSTTRAQFTEPGLTTSAGAQSFKAFQFSFTVAPYPEAGKPIARGDYRLNITVSKAPAS